jgi:outer membrane receptor protein involved in Fe transport
VGERPRESNDVREPVKAYTLVDATIRAHDFYKGLELFCSVHNLLDTSYLKPSLAETFPEDYPLPGRSILVGLRYNLGAP